MKNELQRNLETKVRDYINSHGLTQAEFADRVGVAPATVSQWLSGARLPSLKKMAELDKLFGSSGKSIPVLGQVGAGIPMCAEENVIGWEEISPNLEGEYFALRVHGDSMSPRLQEGDIVICKRQDTAEDGDIVIAIGGAQSEALCKRLRMYKDGIELCSINPAYRPLSFSREEIKSLPVLIVGKALEVRGKL